MSEPTPAAGMQVYIYSHGDSDIQRRLGLLADNVVEMRVVFAEITEILALQEKVAFGRGKKLSPETLANKAAYGFPKTKLVRTGTLRDSLTKAAGGEGAVRVITDSGMMFGTDVWYAIFAKAGTKAGAQGPGEPKRYVLSLTPKTRKTIRLLIMEHLGFGDGGSIL
jgi:phage gpG-like protein